MAVQQQTAQQTLTVLVEEKTFQVRPEECERLIKSAIETAAGIKLEELTPGMWFGSREDGRWTTVEVTARALPTEDGTSVELRVEHKTHPGATTLFVLGAIAGAMLVLPLIALIVYGTRANQQQQRALHLRNARPLQRVGGAAHAPRRRVAHLRRGLSNSLSQYGRGTSRNIYPAVGIGVGDSRPEIGRRSAATLSPAAGNATAREAGGTDHERRSVKFAGARSAGRFVTRSSGFSGP